MKTFLKKIFKLLLNYFGVDFIKLTQKKSSHTSNISNKAMLYPPYSIGYSTIEDYTYVAQNSHINLTSIGKFCSIGPNLMCGWGIHPLNGISTSPMFYSTRKQNGRTFSEVDKVEEIKPIKIGNDVFVGMNVTILDGVEIGDGAVVAAGAVVVGNVPPYAVVAGVPAKIVKYRFDEDKIKKLLKIKWWDWKEDKLGVIEKEFFNVDKFIDDFEKMIP